MHACAEASQAELEAALTSVGRLPTYRELRPAQTGLVMLRGRIGGDGPAFNVGEATVTRAAVQLESGTVGLSYLLGRSQQRAALAAIIDALGQESATHRERLVAALVVPVTARREADEARRRAETAATRVNFFTLVRGED